MKGKAKNMLRKFIQCNGIDERINFVMGTTVTDWQSHELVSALEIAGCTDEEINNVKADGAKRDMLLSKLNDKKDALLEDVRQQALFSALRGYVEKETPLETDINVFDDTKILAYTALATKAVR